MARPTHVAMAWFRRETYAATRDAMADADRLPETYEAWRLSAEQVEREVARSGVAVERVMLDAEPFLAWCRDEAVEPTGAARAHYAGVTLERAHETREGGAD